MAVLTFAMSQMMNLVQMMRNGEVTGEDVIFFEDMFQPGMESLPYIMDQIPTEQRPTSLDPLFSTGCRPR